MAAKPILLSILCFLAISVQTGNGLECYTCVYMPGGATTCLTRPQEIKTNPVLDCKNGEDICCTINKIVQDDEDKTVTSFNRGCQANCNPMNLFKETELGPVIMYQTYCDTPLCNVGPGNEPLSNIEDGDEGDNMIQNVPGIPGAAAPTAPNASHSVILALMQVAAFLIMFNAQH